MSTGKLNLDILLGKIAEDAVSGRKNAVTAIKKQFPSLSEQEVADLYMMFLSALSDKDQEKTSLVTTAPPSFGIRARSTMNTMTNLLENANSSILITGYSLSDYFSDMLDCKIRKSQKGVFVKFFVNQI